MLPVTALYAGLLGLGFLWLAGRAIGARRAHGAALGTPNRAVERAVRAHGNFAEYVPLTLLLLLLNEVNGLPDPVLHLLGALLVAGRALHAAGIAREPEALRWRAIGMVLTLTALGGASAALLGLAIATL